MQVELTKAETWCLRGCLNTIQLHIENNLIKVRSEDTTKSYVKFAEQKLTTELKLIQQIKTKLRK